MKKNIAISLSFAAVAIVLALTLGQSMNNQSEPADVAATIFPTYDITRTIAGDALEVALILPPGASPHTFEPKPSLLRELSSVDVVYSVGLGFDNWIDPIIETVDATEVVLNHDISLLAFEEDHGHEEEGHDEEHEDEHEDEHADEDHHDDEDEHDEEEREHAHEHGEFDPHYWLDAENAKTIARTITEDLSNRYPAHSETFEANLTTYLVELDALDREIQQELGGIVNPHIITLHDGWAYFAETYGLEVIGTFEPTAGREPTPQYLVELMHGLEEAGTSVIYSEPQLGTAGLEAFARDNDLTIIEIDPIGGIDTRDSYISLMRFNAAQLKNNK